MAIAIYVDSLMEDAAISEHVLEESVPYDAVKNFLPQPDEDRDPHLGAWWK